MRAVVQRVRSARVLVAGGAEEARIGPGAVVLVAVRRGDTAAEAEGLAGKIARLRLFDDAAGRLNGDIASVKGAFLVVSQFTLYGDCRKGNRPSYLDAAPPEEAMPIYERFVEYLRAGGREVRTGRFREHMVVALENDGPVTVIVERDAAPGGGAG